MECDRHPGKEAVGRCLECGAAICPECVKEARQILRCPSCHEKTVAILAARMNTEVDKAPRAKRPPRQPKPPRQKKEKRARGAGEDAAPEAAPGAPVVIADQGANQLPQHAGAPGEATFQRVTEEYPSPIEPLDQEADGKDRGRKKKPPREPRRPGEKKEKVRKAGRRGKGLEDALPVESADPQPAALMYPEAPPVRPPAVGEPVVPPVTGPGPAVAEPPAVADEATNVPVALEAREVAVAARVETVGQPDPAFSVSPTADLQELAEDGFDVEAETAPRGRAGGVKRQRPPRAEKPPKADRVKPEKRARAEKPPKADRVKKRPKPGKEPVGIPTVSAPPGAPVPPPVAPGTAGEPPPPPLVSAPGYPEGPPTFTEAEFPVAPKEPGAEQPSGPPAYEPPPVYEERTEMTPPPLTEPAPPDLDDTPTRPVVGAPGEPPPVFPGAGAPAVGFEPAPVAAEGVEEQPATKEGHPEDVAPWEFDFALTPEVGGEPEALGAPPRAFDSREALKAPALPEATGSLEAPPPPVFGAGDDGVPVLGPPPASEAPDDRALPPVLGPPPALEQDVPPEPGLPLPPEPSAVSTGGGPPAFAEDAFPGGQVEPAGVPAEGEGWEFEGSFPDVEPDEWEDKVAGWETSAQAQGVAAPAPPGGPVERPGTAEAPGADPLGRGDEDTGSFFFEEEADRDREKGEPDSFWE